MAISILTQNSVLNEINSSFLLNSFSDFPSELSCLLNDDPVFGTPKTVLNIISQPVSQTKISGENVTFSVVVNNFGSSTYQWYFNNILIQNATSSSYTINSITKNQAGNYYVVVNNNFSTITSNNAVLTVLTPPVITVQPKSQTVAVGVQTIFSVQVESGLQATYQWYFNNSLIVGATSSELKIPDSSSINNGIYYVIISNSDGIIRSNNAVLFVLYPNPPNPPNPPNRADIGNDLFSKLYNQLYNQFYNQLYNQIYNQIYNQLYIQLYNVVIDSYYETGPPAVIPVPTSSTDLPDSAVSEKKYDELYNTLYNSMYDNLYDELYNQLYNPIYDNLFLKFSQLPYSDTSSLNISYQNVNTNNDKFGTTYNQIFNQIIKQLYSQIFTQLFNQLYPQLNQQIYNS